jgi:hypothetical protein
MSDAQPRSKSACCGNRFKKARLLSNRFNQRHRKPVVTRKETRRQRHAREPTTRAKVSNLSAVRQESLNARRSYQ